MGNNNSMTSEVLRLKGFKEVAGGRFERVNGSSEPSGGQSGSNLHPEAKAVASRRVRQSSKPLMNRLETEFHQHLVDRFNPAQISCQSIKLRLANGLTYLPDFIVFSPHGVLAFETKGKWIDGDSIPKLKMAAAVYPCIKFTLVWKIGGVWKSQEILP
jgi:hypothetical protein